MPTTSGPGGQSLGNARGTISLDTSSLQKGVGDAQRAGQQIAAGLKQVDTGATAAQKGVQSLSGALSQFGSALGIVGGIAGAVKLGQFALDADATATAYKRQNVAALSLAGSQSKLNELLAAYGSATGNAVDKAQSLADVVKLQSTGFADSAAELEQFATAARGISVATGRTQDYVISQLQLAIANDSTMRLDQLGLGIAEVAAKKNQLKAADASLTKEQITQNAILGIALQKFGALAKSTEAQATGAEKAAKAWKDFKLELGTLLGPDISDAMDNLTKALQESEDWFAQVAEKYNELRLSFGNTSEVSGLNDVIAGGLANLKVWTDGLTEAGNAIRGLMGLQLSNAAAQAGPQYQLQFAGSTAGANSFAQGIGGFSGGASIDPNAEKQEADKIDHWKAIQAIDKSAFQASQQATQQYASQRAETIRSYELGIAREAQAFGISRARAATQLAETIAGIQEDSAKQAADWAEDLADSIGKLQADSGKRTAEATEASNKRIAEINEEYAINREKAERSHRDTLLDAAANLDARAVFEEQRNFAESSKEAAEAHDKALQDEGQNLAERTAKEAESLSERIQQEQEANTKRLADAKEADAQRITDAQEALAKQQAIEDEDRALSLAQQQEDYQAQLAAMAQAQAEQLAQIQAHAAEERAAEDEAFLAKLAADGLQNEAWAAQQEQVKKLALKNFDDFWAHVIKKFEQSKLGASDDLKTLYPNSFASGGYVSQNMLANLHAGEVVMNKAQVAQMGGYSGVQAAARGGNSVGDVSFAIYAAAGQSPEEIGRAVKKEVIGLLQGTL